MAQRFRSVVRSPMSRRTILATGLGVLAARVARAQVSTGPGEPASAAGTAQRQPRFAALGLVPDENGFLLPEGFTSRVIARSGEFVPGTDHTFLDLPDGAGVVPLVDGGWWLVWNGEVGNGGGGVCAIRFAADGTIVSAATLLDGLNRACAGGITPWGTWLACEEVDRGTVWEVDPGAVKPPVQHLAMGRFRHEAAAVDGARRTVYLSEDEPNGLFYRYVYPPAGLADGVLQAAKVGADGAVTWLTVPDASAAVTQCRVQVPATPFAGGEGLAIFQGRSVYLASKLDNRVWCFDILDQRMRVVYSPSPGSALTGVDNITVSPGNDVLVCEDGGNMEVVAIGLDGSARPLLRLTGQADSELTGVNLAPSGTRLYVGSQRAISATQGIVYEVSGPFPW